MHALALSLEFCILLLSDFAENFIVLCALSAAQGRVCSSFFKVNIATRVCLLFVKYVYVDEKPDSRGCECVNAVTPSVKDLW